MARTRGLEAATSGATISWTTELASTYQSTDGNTRLWKYVVDYAPVDRDVYHGCLSSTSPFLDAIFYLFVLTTLIEAPSSLQGIDSGKTTLPSFEKRRSLHGQFRLHASKGRGGRPHGGLHEGLLCAQIAANSGDLSIRILEGLNTPQESRSIVRSFWCGLPCATVCSRSHR
jgi:hypothetical protein